MYIPLRELCRKFDGYQIQQIPPQEVPWLVLPPEANVFDRSPAALKILMTAVKPGRGAQWNMGNSFEIPQIYIDRALELYNGSRAEPERWSKCVELCTMSAFVSSNVCFIEVC